MAAARGEEILGDSQRNVPPQQVTAVSANFDLETYIASYRGLTRISRLIFIGDLCPPLRLEAYKLALRDITKDTTDTKRYLGVVSRLLEAQRAAGQALTTDTIGASTLERRFPGIPVDQEWVAQTDKDSATRGTKLDIELKSYQNSLIKESIRMAHTDLGDHYYKRGDLTNALKSYQRTRDYCTTSKHIVQMCLNVIKVAVELRHFAHVNTYASKAMQTPEVAKDNPYKTNCVFCLHGPDLGAARREYWRQKQTMTASKLAAAMGLYYLHYGDYRLAAVRFLDVSFELNNNFSEVLSAQDVGLYGALCALACFDRQELKSKVLNHANFRQYIELVPKLRSLVESFVSSRYVDVFAYMEQSKAHIDTLYDEIRKRSLIQYFVPYQAVNLHQMSTAFGMPMPDLEVALIRLILDDEIKARIDSQRKIMYARQSDVRSATLERTLTAGQQFTRQAKAALLRMNMQKAHFVVGRETEDTWDAAATGADDGGLFGQPSGMAVDADQASAV